ncbi:MAG: GNAT family N-acetyltransferase [Candidatus Thioglobus sp.]|nr:GNAT family N-acetyltransferase [Candidatus Thioglobus sp.]
MSDKASQILKLLAPFVQEGKILPRTHSQISANIDDFVLLFEEKKLIACAGLKPYKKGAVGEIYSLAVAENSQKTGAAAKLLTQIISKAKKLNCTKIFALSKHNINWFLKQKFTQMEVGDLPENRQKSFDHQRNSCIFFKDL